MNPDRAFYERAELLALGFRRIGQGVRLSRKASLYGVDRIEIGDLSRIDDFCILSAGVDGISIGRNVHIASFGGLYGQARIAVDDFANLSSRVALYSSSDDYHGARMTNPTVPSEYTGVSSAPVRIGRGAIVGCASVILPGVVLGDYAAVGACSLVRSSCDPFAILAGVPATVKGVRRRDLVSLEEAYLRAEADEHGDAIG